MPLPLERVPAVARARMAGSSLRDLGCALAPEVRVQPTCQHPDAAGDAAHVERVEGLAQGRRSPAHGREDVGQGADDERSIDHQRPDRGEAAGRLRAGQGQRIAPPVDVLRVVDLVDAADACGEGLAVDAAAVEVQPVADLEPESLRERRGDGDHGAPVRVRLGRRPVARDERGVLVERLGEAEDDDVAIGQAGQTVAVGASRRPDRARGRPQGAGDLRAHGGVGGVGVLGMRGDGDLERRLGR